MRLLKAIGITAVFFVVVALVMTGVFAWCRFVDTVLMPHASFAVQTIVVMLPTLIAIFVLMAAAIYSHVLRPDPQEETSHGG
jgi:NADH:ubiquinone oxidoreductase subunit 5 (subunit L)/multisubunit Na+/H+ antiporter MnhA subunit